MRANLDKIKHKAICVLGLGKTGRAAIEFFKKNDVTISVFDDNQEVLETVSKIYGVDKFAAQEIDALFISPGIPNNKIKQHHLINSAVEKNISIISDIEIFQSIYPNAKYIGVTGTNGKSTTAALIDHILKKNMQKRVELCGNIGTPVLSVKEADIYILELSSFQIDLLKKPKLDISICINITPDHFDTYLDIDDYANSKARIFLDNSLNIISIDYPICKKIFSHLKHCIAISIEKVLDVGVSFIDSKLIISNCLGIAGRVIYDMPYNHSLLGRYNAENIMCAVCACMAIGISIENILESILSFNGLPHRMELILHNKKNNIVFINDSKATNAISTQAAFEAFKDRKIVWIAGGLCKDDGIEVLKDYFELLEKVYLLGNSMNQFYAVLEKYGINAIKSNTLESALEDIKNFIPKNCLVLLSPACASTDQWKNFEERGKCFTKIVREMF